MLFTGLCTGGADVGVMDVATTDMAIVPIFEPRGEGGGLRRAMGGIVATAAIEVHASALIVTATTTVASVESVSTATIVGAMNAANRLPLMALVLLLVTTATTRTTILIGLLLCVLEHANRGLVANGIAEHLNLPLNIIHEVIIVA